MGTVLSRKAPGLWTAVPTAASPPGYLYLGRKLSLFYWSRKALEVWGHKKLWLRIWNHKTAQWPLIHYFHSKCWYSSQTHFVTDAVSKTPGTESQFARGAFRGCLSVPAPPVYLPTTVFTGTAIHCAQHWEIALTVSGQTQSKCSFHFHVPQSHRG